MLTTYPAAGAPPGVCSVPETQPVSPRGASAFHHEKCVTSATKRPPSTVPSPSSTHRPSSGSNHHKSMVAPSLNGCPATRGKLRTADPEKVTGTPPALSTTSTIPKLCSGNGPMAPQASMPGAAATPWGVLRRVIARVSGPCTGAPSGSLKVPSTNSMATPSSVSTTASGPGAATARVTSWAGASVSSTDRP